MEKELLRLKNNKMILRQDIGDKFLNLFNKVMENEPLENGNKLNVFVLKVSNNRFNYISLNEELENALISYALSRNTYDELVGQKKFGNLSSMAREKLRNADSNKGELGELLLYCLLESHLHAPKLLTKLELKTASNDYVKGADGVHLLQINDTSFQLIFGESKLYSKLNEGINAAFHSIKTMMDVGLDKIRYEIHLVNSNLLKESVSEESASLLKKILIPSENDIDINIDNSFGVFLGFEIVISEDELKENKERFIERMIDKVETSIKEQIPTINNHLKEAQFYGYNFYFYVMPFSELEKTRTTIINKLKN